MSHVRKDTLVRTREWAKHLRPWGKRVQAKMERKAAEKEMKKDFSDKDGEVDYDVQN